MDFMIPVTKDSDLFILYTKVYGVWRDIIYSFKNLKNIFKIL